MKISEIISGLEKLKKEYGDLPVHVLTPDSFERGDCESTEAHLVIECGNNDKAEGVLVCDFNTYDAFR